MLTFSRTQHISAQILLLTFILVNIFLLQSSTLGLVLGLIFLWYNSKKIADIFFPRVHRGLKNLLGFILIISLVSALYTLAYHVYKINIYIFTLAIVSIPLIIEIMSYSGRVEHIFLGKIKLDAWSLPKIKNIILPTLVLIIDGLLVYYLFHKASVDAIRSPWELVSYKFWWLLSISNLLLIFSILHKRSNKNIFLISAHFILLSSMAVILYKVGYGYDSFIHGATLKIIEQSGTIQPRLFIYVGQYGLTLFFSRLFQIDILTINKILLPIFFGLIWPNSVYYGLRYCFRWSFRMSYLGVLLSLLVSYGYFIMTSPQSLSFLFVVLVVFISPHLRKNEIPVWLTFILALTTMTIHPISGIPLLFMAFILSFDFWLKNKYLKKIINIVIYIFSAIALPVFLGLYQWLNGVAAKNIINQPLKWPLPPIKTHWLQAYDFPFDWLHNIGQNLPTIYFIISIIGLYLILSKHKFTFFKNQLILLGILISNYLLTKIFINFNLQIAYQKDDYPNRILFLIALCALPIFLTSFYYLIHQHIKKQPKIINSLWFSTLTLILLSASIYFSYPVYDRYLNNKSVSVSASDIKSVQLIDQDANGEPYVVLANQMVGAAAIHEFGFAKYYNNNFYYSMPLGTDNIYQEFLKMIEEKASIETAQKAMEKAQVKRLYFVVNQYWHSSAKAREEAAVTADKIMTVDDGKNQIYLYLSK